jgi:hypothetical protein
MPRWQVTAVNYKRRHNIPGRYTRSHDSTDGGLVLTGFEIEMTRL